MNRVSPKREATLRAENGGRLPMSTITRKVKPCTSTGVRYAKRFGNAAIRYVKSARRKSALSVLRKRSQTVLPRPAVRVFPGGREVCNLKTIAGNDEYCRRIHLMLIRQKGLCCNCRKPIYPESPCFEHEVPRGLGGGWRDDRIEINGKPVNGASHILCNSVRGSRRTPI